MGTVIYWVHASVDGFIDGPRGEFDWPVMGPELSAYSEALDDRTTTLLYGRPVWEMMVGFWPDADRLGNDPHTRAFAPFWRATPKLVVSSDYPGDNWTDRVIRPDDVRDLDGTILLTGGSGLAAALTERGLIDEYHVATHPVVLGGGKPLFAATDTRRTLDLRSSRVLDQNIVVNVYTLSRP
ncbi:dihydrofolate reductase family protein [Cryptosporangium phraense]|uniref:Dihydrofolate reductase n=1 Tax=Cryptosporangium phraense TaxID=2593070 RepID=A0A545AMI3_9ACTN|nr:dihydrofolate reductase family protein [Cryptosporangium phraense]TQS41935.1 dihydrofolate reductase [Cryptosporangium phraense]